MEKPDQPQVYAAISKVQAALAATGISKNNQSQGAYSFKFRGIDDVFNAVCSLMPISGLVCIPHLDSCKVEPVFTKDGSNKEKRTEYATVEVSFILAALDGSTVTGRSAGQAMDTGDKAVGKAISYATKAFYLTLFTVPTEGDNDPDAASHVLTTPPKPETPQSFALRIGMTQEDIGAIKAIAGTGDKVWEAIKDAQDAQCATPAEVVAYITEGAVPA